jgi:recombination protein RecR
VKEQELLDQVVEAFRCLPGVGPKSAQRMLLYLLERDRTGGKQLAALLNDAMEKIGHCHSCRNYCEAELCSICQDPGRDERILCVVETPADVIAIEQSASFRGRYFVLMGTLSPIDGRGPEELGIDSLLSRCEPSASVDKEPSASVDKEPSAAVNKEPSAAANIKNEINEIILAVSSTVEGEATAHYIAEAIKPTGVTVTRIAQGIPVGGELEYVDGGTLLHAIEGRKSV